MLELLFVLTLTLAGSPSVVAQDAPSPSPPTPVADEQPKPPTTAAEPPPAKPAPTRDALIKRPGAPRKPLESLRATQRVNANQPQGAKIDDVLRGEKQDDDFLDAYAAWQVAEITKPGNEADRTILNTLARFTEQRGSADSAAVSKYKKALVKHLAQSNVFKNNSILMQVNALHNASEIQNGFADVNDAIPIFISVLKDPDREQGIHYVALNGIIRAKSFNLVRANDEQEAARVILDYLNRVDIQSVLRAKLYETLGTLERPYDQRPSDAKIASVLANAVLNQNLDPDARAAAGLALARLRLVDVAGWNSLVQAQVVAMALRDSLGRRAPDRGNVKAKAQDAQRAVAFRWAKAIEKGAAEAPNKANPDFQDFAKTTALEKVLAPILDQLGASLDPIDEWIEKHPLAAELKFTATAEPLTIQKPVEETPTDSTSDEKESAEPEN
jgi:hypothetical protein